MKTPYWSGVGLIGRLVAILLLALAVEFVASTLLYERATEFSVRDDEARRLAEHLVIARRLVTEAAPERRATMADELTTDRYFVRWSTEVAPLPVDGPAPQQIREQVLAWEPSLQRQELRLGLLPIGGKSVITGTLRLSDDSWLYFRTLEPVKSIGLPLERMLVALIPAIAVLVMGGLLIRRTLQPIQMLTGAVQRFKPGQPLPHVEEAGTGEMRRLIGSFNEMQARIDRLVDERTRALAAVGHDLRTPLARLRLRTDAIISPHLRREVEADIEGMEAMVNSMLAFLGGEDDPEQPRRIDLAVLCASVVDDATDHGHEVEYIGPQHLERVLRPTGMRRAVVNLVNNAVRYGKHVELRLELAEGLIRIHVEDDGPGIPEESLQMVLEPFVRLDSARGRDTAGFGLGLSIVSQSVGAQGGKLILENRRQGGLRATIALIDTVQQ